MQKSLLQIVYKRFRVQR